MRIWGYHEIRELLLVMNVDEQSAGSIYSLFYLQLLLAYSA